MISDAELKDILEARIFYRDENAIKIITELIEARRQLAWAYSKVHCFMFSKLDDALMLDEIKNSLEER